MKTNQRITLFLSFIVALFCVVQPTTASAKEKAIPSIAVDVLLQDDGSAVITESWQVEDVYGGTEYYKAIENADGMRVHSLTVWDESGTTFRTLDQWDTSLSREEKTNTCGILQTKKGYEICWGIGTYGNRQYTIQYTLDGLVRDYGDYAGFYHQFISEFSSAPENASVKIHKQNTDLTTHNARIWTYGFTGEDGFDNNGTLYVVSSENFDKSDYVNVLCRFNKNVFSVLSKEDKSFDELYKMAEKANSDFATYLVLGIVLGISSFLIALAVFFTGRYKLNDGTIKRLPSKKNLESTSAIPFSGSIPAMAAMLAMLHKDVSLEKLMSGYLVRWQQAGYVRLEKKEKLKGRRTQNEEAITFSTGRPPQDPVELSLYTILFAYADENGVLWAHTMEKHAEKLYEKLDEWQTQVIEQGENALVNTAIAVKTNKNHLSFTQDGFQQAIRVLGFQKYLYEIRKPNKSLVPERDLWGDYLVFAILFGIEEEILKSLQVMDPVYYDTFSRGYGCDTYSMMYFLTVTNHIASTPGDTSGMGGSSSSMGGGGFSGGGGGGSR